MMGPRGEITIASDPIYYLLQDVLHFIVRRVKGVQLLSSSVIQIGPSSPEESEQDTTPNGCDLVEQFWPCRRCL